MSDSRQKVFVVTSDNSASFERECAILDKNGYKIDSSSCAISISKDNIPTRWYTAIFKLKEKI